eukprot:NODE_266_length_12318_cov_0.301498.p4 type:complete len:245 gc:universal NODE_266_length_12318_cov_0.301498:1739-2473(+)
MIRVFPIKCLSDNYSYIVQCLSTNRGVLIDPVDPSKAFKVADDNNINIVQSLVTHHHLDHHSIKELLKIRSIPVISGDVRIPNSEIIHDGQSWKVGEMTVQSIFTPGHTNGHYSYFIHSNKENHVFTGDFLFIGGCGRFFEGTAKTMWNSILKFKQLPKDTKVWVGHEYTASNYKWALSVAKTSELEDRYTWALGQDMTVPSTVELEASYNLFVNSDSEKLFRIFNTDNPVNVLSALRDSKDNF